MIVIVLNWQIFHCSVSAFHVVMIYNNKPLNKKQRCDICRDTHRNGLVKLLYIHCLGISFVSN